jgi:hypothetical protein
MRLAVAKASELVTTTLGLYRELALSALELIPRR